MVIMLYEDDLNLISMNINEKLDKIAEQLRVYTYKITHFPAAYGHRVPKVVPNVC